ncbi:hypothetical protein RJT34_17178 [Clitoria ternatea]|uniref:Uncharacterized protein n=1 Tax=Clitoria ternatea TaxID=43366 RepID=A0AAN9PDJ1_CLITE
MLPRFHVKDAYKGGAKAPPRNKMALYEQFNVGTQSFASGSSSMFSLPLKNHTIPTSSTHVNSSQSFQFRTSNAPSILAERNQTQNAKKINFTNFTQDDSISKKYPKALDGENAFITSYYTHEKKSNCSIFQQNVKDEDTLARCNLSFSFETPNSLKKMNSCDTMELNSSQYEKNKMQEHTKMSKNFQKSRGDGFGDMTNASLFSLVKGSRHEEHHIEKPLTNDIHKCPLELEIGKGDDNQAYESYKHFNALNKAITGCTSDINISPDNVMSEEQFWKARKTIINQHRIFAAQVFELHKLIKVQRLIARLPHIFLEDKLLFNRPPQRTSSKKLQSNFIDEQSSSIVELDHKSDKVTTTDHAKTNAIDKIHIPFVDSVISKSHANQLPNYSYNLGNLGVAFADINSKPPSFVYPPPRNQWLVPIMSPYDGLVYKPIEGPSHPNAGFMTPMYDHCGTMNLNLGTRDVFDAATIALGSHQKFGIHSDSSLPQFLLPPFMHPSSTIEQIRPSKALENHHSCDVNYAMFYQSSSNTSNQASQLMSSNISTYHSLLDQEAEKSTTSSSSKRIKGDVLPLFPVTPTFFPSTDENTQVKQQPPVIKAMPHTPKSATESAAQIFKSIQEENKPL